jgi:uncharacterized membrane protein YjgN (DUF898 family)
MVPENYREGVKKIRVGEQRIRFEGDLKDFYVVHLKNWAYTTITFGFYSFLGYAQHNVTKYIDDNLEFA